MAKKVKEEVKEVPEENTGKFVEKYLPWLHDFENKFLSSISWVYTFHGNTKDVQMISANQYVPFHVLFREFVIQNLDVKLFAIYDRALGWKFPIQEHKELAVMNYQIDWDRADLDPLYSFQIIDNLLTTRLNVCIIMDNVENALSSDKWGANPIVDMFATKIRSWSSNSEVSRMNNLFVMLCKDNISYLHPALRDLETHIEPVYVKYPNQDLREMFLEACISRYNDDASFTFPPNKEVASSTAGLSLTMIEDCILRCLAEKKFDMSFIKERKDEVIRATYGDVIEIKEPETDWKNIGGMKRIQEFFTENVIAPMKSGNNKRCPMGVLMSGPPGTGKTVAAEAVAKDANVLFVKLNFSKVFSKWVGDSEKNLDRILKAIETMSPAIVFIDEIDQSGHRRGGAGEGDSGVSSRVFQRLLEFMSDTKHRGRIVFLAATNRPDLLDAAMKRAGRFDKKIPFLAPTRDQRKFIFFAVMRKHGLKLKVKDKKFPEKVIDLTKNYVGADIESIVLTAYEIADKKKAGTVAIREEDLLEAAQCLRPSVSIEQIQEMSKLAILECNDMRLVPPDWDKELTKGSTKTESDEWQRTRKFISQLKKPESSPS